MSSKLDSQTEFMLSMVMSRAVDGSIDWLNQDLGELDEDGFKAKRHMLIAEFYAMQNNAVAEFVKRHKVLIGEEKAKEVLKSVRETNKELDEIAWRYPAEVGYESDEEEEEAEEAEPAAAGAAPEEEGDDEAEIPAEFAEAWERLQNERAEARNKGPSALRTYEHWNGGMAIIYGGKRVLVYRNHAFEIPNDRPYTRAGPLKHLGAYNHKTLKVDPSVPAPSVPTTVEELYPWLTDFEVRLYFTDDE
jgi:hypothetical protein